MVGYIWVRTRCVEEGWHGGCERSEPTCNQAQVNAICAAVDRIYTRIKTCLNLTGLTDLVNCIIRAHDNVVWKCASLSSGAVAQCSGNEITLTPAAFASTTARFEAIVFHEIIHACGGTELDSEGFQNHCYRNSGATAPTSDDFPKFCDEGGRWLNWDGSTGRVTTKAGQNLNINTSDFIGTCPPDGGWI